MMRVRLSFVVAVLALFPVLSRGGVLITEIMYQPASFSTNEEWIEIWNAGPTNVNLQGWRFTKGIDFTFTNSYNLAVGGFAVVCANFGVFSINYPEVVTAGRAFGGWKGTLKNSGDTIRLVDSAGNNVSEVSYANEGDWAFRRPGLLDRNHRGWEWYAPHDGTGKTVELINPNQVVDSGQNWAASLASGGTPGRTNSVYSTNTAPLILEVAHYPLVPRSQENISITARIRDPRTNGTTVRLFYRLDSYPQSNPFIAVPMFDDAAHNDGVAGDFIFGATLPPQTNTTVIEFYVEAVTSNGRTNSWPAPAVPAADGGGPTGHAANALLQVDDTTYPGNQPVYRVLMTETERRERDVTARADSQSDAAENATLISIEGSGSELRYLCSIRERGAGSRGAVPPNHHMTVPDDHRWKGVASFNLNSRFTHSQMAGYALASKSGLHTENARIIQLRINSTNVAGAGSPQYGSYIHVEAVSPDFVDAHFPEDSAGNLYRMSDGTHRANLSYRGPDYTSYSTVGYTKQNNSSENDWSDLINLTATLDLTPDASYVQAVRQVVNVEQWMLYLAVFTLTDSQETSLANGAGDDYSMYRGRIDTRFQLIAHDWDTILGQGDTAGTTNASIFRMVPLVRGVTNGNSGIVVFNRFVLNPEFAPIYYATLKRLCETAFSPPQLSATLDDALGSWVPASVIASMKVFGTNRASWVLTQIPTNITVTSSLPVVSGLPQSTFPNVTLRGVSDPINTRSVLVNGAAASWSAWDGRWTNSSVALVPGLNRVVVQALNSNGVEILRTTYDVWFNNGTGTAVSGTIANSTWTAANSPYNVTGNLTIPAGVTLTIQAGASVFVSPGVTITVNGTLLAQGSDFQRIRFSKVPGSGNWGSLDFINTGTVESRLAYVDFDSCAGTTIGGHAAQLHVNNSRIFIDHCTWPNTPVQEYISFDASSFVVQNCVFPTYPFAIEAPEMLHGVNGIQAGGYGIFRDNYFGHTWGFNDTIDFTGGNRPGPILQVIGNVFDGAGDDHLDLDSTDAWIEGNIFLHAHRDPNRSDRADDTASAISGGVDVANQYSEWTIINNLFYDVDHAVMVKGGNRFTFVNNTVVHVSKEGGGGLTNDIAAFDFTDDAVPFPPAPVGAGAYIANNIIWDMPQLTANYSAPNYTVIFDNNVMQLPWSGAGTNNLIADPLLNLQLINAATNADWKTVLAALTPRQGSPALRTGWGAKYDRGGLNPAGLMVIGEPYPFTSATSATLTVLPGGILNWGTNAYLWGYTHYKWKLDNGAWSAELPITSSPTISLSGLSAGPHTVYVSGKSDAGYYQDDTFVYPVASSLAAHLTASRTWIVTNTPGRVQINEVLARNAGGVEIGGKSPDAIELFNPGTAPITLSGMGITDDPLDPYKYVFDSGVVIGPGQYLLLIADLDKDTNGIHIGFGLNEAGDALFLFDTVARGSALLDSVKFGFQLPNLSIARLPDLSWSLALPTLGAANAAYPAADPSRIKINEWLADESAGNDFVELYNPDPVPVDVGNCYMTDLPASFITRNQLPPLSFVPARGFKVLIADGDPQQGADHLSFKLSPDRGEIALFSPALAVIDWILYGPQTTDVSEGRAPDGALTRSFFNQPTPGAPNPGGGDCTITSTSFSLLPMVSSWKYNRNGVDLGTTWRTSSYNDSSWSTGTALLGVEDCGCLPVPLSTVFSAYSNTQIVYYFRTTFVNTSNLIGVTLTLSHVLDDGAVIYLDGSELTRIRMPGGTITATTQPNGVVGDGALETLTLPNVTLAAGVHQVAVEVHNGANPTSSDVVWGMALDVTRFITNCAQTNLVLNEVMANNKSYTNLDGTISDWVELYNPSAAAVDLTDMSLSDDSSTPRRWVFPAGISIPPGGYLVVKCDGGAPASTNLAGSLNTGFGFGASGDKALLFDRQSRGGSLLDSVAFGLQAPDFTIGRIPNGTGAWTLNLPSEAAINIASSTGNVALVRINEWMADPKSGDDWFELFNPNAQPVAIGDCYLTDLLSDRTQYRIPKLSYIGIGFKGFVQFQADGSPTKGADHTNFKLSAGGESIGFYAPDGITAIDTITFGQQLPGVSEGRFPDGAANIIKFFETPTPANANYLPFNDITINEALTHSDLPLEDAIELFNSTATPINIGGWYISDTPGNPRKFRIPDNTIVQAYGFVVFYENQFNATPGLGGSFALSSGNGDQIHLSVADAAGNLTGYRVTEDFGAQANGVSFGKFESSIGFDFAAMSNRTFGVDTPATVEQFRTSTGATNSYPRVGPVVMNEIHYHPPDIGTNDNVFDEFIELYNFATTNVALYDAAFPSNVWHLRNAVDFDFPPNTIVPARGYLIVVGFDPATNSTVTASFRTRYGVPGGVTLVGPMSGKLNNDEDNIELRRPDTPNTGDVPYVLVERVHYHDGAPWPYAADWNTNGNGFSLQRIIPQSFGNDPANWRAGVPTAGLTNGPAGGSVPAFGVQPANRIATLGSNVSFSTSAGGTLPVTVQWRFNGIDIFGATNNTLNLTNVQFANVGRYSVRAMNAYGVIVSTNAFLTLAAPPEIAIQPQSRAAIVGQPVSFTVGARGAAPLSYQWRKDGNNIAGATALTFTIPSVQNSDEGSYTVVVTNSYGAVTSAVAFLTFNAAPLIVTQPRSTNVVVNQSVALSVGAVGSPPLFYQWRFNGLNLVGQNSSTLTLNNVQVSQGGSYSVVVSNAFGVVPSSNAILTVIVPPVVSITATDPNAAEAGLDPGQFQITRAGATNFALTVGFTIGGSAANGTDYQAIPSSVTIPLGATSVVVNVQPNQDTAPEAAETVILTLNTAPEYILGNPSSATVTIADNDNLPPSVVLTSPAANSVYPVTPTNIQLTATASDPDGGIGKVEFFWNGTNKIGEVLGAGPYTFTWTNADAGSNLLTAVASDIYGLVVSSAPVPVFINGAPFVSITTPADTSSVPEGDVQVAATAIDTNGTVTHVDFYVGGKLFGSVADAPYSVMITNAALGAYQTYAIAYDDFGLAATSAVANFTVVVANTNFSDMFATRGFVSGITNFSVGSNTTATLEAGEQPPYPGRVGGKSIWLSWTAPAVGMVAIDAFGSSFDTLLSVYTNRPGIAPNVSNIVVVAQNDDSSSPVSLQSRVFFTNRVRGTLYHITLDGFRGISGTAQLHIGMSNTSPYVTTQPLSQTNNPGANINFSAAAVGASPLAYRWRFNGTPLANATNNTFSIINAQAGNNGSYDVVITNSIGAVTSSVATLIIRTAPVITQQPANQFAILGGNATFNVIATGGSLAYQWRFNNSNIGGANSASYTRLNVGPADLGSYVVVITNLLGSVTSAPASLTITAPPSLVALRWSNNVFSAFLKDGPTGGYYIEVSTNMDAWSTVTTITNAGAAVSFSDTNAAPRRTYRARLIP